MFGGVGLLVNEADVMRANQLLQQASDEPLEDEQAFDEDGNSSA